MTPYTGQNASFCTYCNTYVSEDHWYWMTDNRYKLGGKWRCRQQKRDSEKRYREKIKAGNNPSGREAQLRGRKAFQDKNPHLAKYKAYKTADKKANRIHSITWLEAQVLFNQNCFYCNTIDKIGIDRKDSSKGHTLENSISCCEKCNMILGDLPFEAKLLLKPALEQIQIQNLLQQWTIPTKRQICRQEDLNSLTNS